MGNKEKNLVAVELMIKRLKLFKEHIDFIESDPELMEKKHCQAVVDNLKNQLVTIKSIYNEDEYNLLGEE